MRPLASLVSGALVLGFSALALAMAPPARLDKESEVLAPPPPVAVVKALALGRHAAASDLAWLRTVQFIGAPHSEKVRYAGMEDWIEVITDLSPRAEHAYYHGGILLATLPGRDAAASEIFAKAEQHLVPDECRSDASCPAPDFSSADDVAAKCVPCPALVERGCNWEVPLSHGYAAHFGALDAKRAARLFCESRRRGGPAYLTRFAARLTRQATSCQQLRQDLGGVASLADGQGGHDMLRRKEQQLRILEHCEKDSLKRAAQKYRFTYNRAPESVQELLDAAILDAPPWVPHPASCWVRSERTFGFELVTPCPR